MIIQGFHIGQRDWWVMVYYDINDINFDDVCDALVASGMSHRRAKRAVSVLTDYDTGMTYTNFANHATVMLISKASSAEQMYDTIQHEARHAADHIGEYYGLDARGEESAYLQGEIARQMFPAASMVICPACP